MIVSVIVGFPGRGIILRGAITLRTANTMKMVTSLTMHNHMFLAVILTLMRIIRLQCIVFVLFVVSRIAFND